MILDEQLHVIPQFEIIEYHEDEDITQGFGEGWVYEEEEE